MISFLVSEAKCDGANFYGTFAIHEVCGVFPGATESRCVQAFRDLEDFESSLHSLAWKLEAWPVEMIGPQSDLSLDRIMNFSLSFAARLPFGPDSPKAPTSPDSSDAHKLPPIPDSRKRARKEDEAKKA